MTMTDYLGNSNFKPESKSSNKQIEGEGRYLTTVDGA